MIVINDLKAETIGGVFMSKKYIILWIICLVVADQGIKIIVANYLFDTKFDVIESVLGFRPVFNTKYSYVNTLLFDQKLGLSSHLILLIFAQILVVFYYDIFNTLHKSKLSDFVFIFGQSLILCVFSGFFLWKDGILDYFFVYPFVFDLKDIYVHCFVISLFCYYFKNKTIIRNSNFKITDYFIKRWADFKTGFKN